MPGNYPYISTVVLAAPQRRLLSSQTGVGQARSFTGHMITVADAELLERETELHTLHAQLDSARHGCGTITLVEAPAGQGKTTLLRAVRAEASVIVPQP